MFFQTALLSVIVQQALALPAGHAALDERGFAAPVCAVIDYIVQQAHNAQATSFCSSFLHLPTATASFQTTATVTAATQTVTTTVATVTQTQTDISTTTSTAFVLRQRALEERYAAVPTPSCFKYVADSVISAACQCLDLPGQTTSVTVTAKATTTPSTTVLATATTVTTTQTTTTTTFTPQPSGFYIQITSGPGYGQYAVKRSGTGDQFIGFTTNIASADVFILNGDGSVQDLSQGSELYYYKGNPVNYVVTGGSDDAANNNPLKATIQSNGNIDFSQNPGFSATPQPGLCGGAIAVIPNNLPGAYGCYGIALGAVTYTG